MRFLAFAWHSLGFFRQNVVSGLTQAGEMFDLLLQMVMSAVRRPVGFWGDVRVQMFDALRTILFPLVFSTFMFGFTVPGLEAANAFLMLGIPDRLGSFFLAAGVREFTPWLNAIVVAGVVGTRLTADLGTRRIRQEFDAMEVMGFDPVREVVLPRVVGVTLVTGLTSIIALACGVVAGWAAAQVSGAAPDAFFASFFTNATTTDLAASLLKATLFGLIIGTVCAYKGYAAEGGPTGVGRAVNQAVVAAFAGVWVTNLLFSSLLLGTHPELTYSR
jgi:phospholipid/cholesterol/gamma-HCH transport system permease protein